jgi:hypothetical protein
VELTAASGTTSPNTLVIEGGDNYHIKSALCLTPLAQAMQPSVTEQFVKLRY